MLYNLVFLFMIFIGYAFLGKVGETIYYVYSKKKLVNRGYLYGPYMPIWGIEALILLPILMMLKSSLLLVFLGGMLIGSAIEYLASYILEDIFKSKWWDYSKERFNLNGRICLKYSLYYGFISLIIIYLINPYYMKLLKSIDHNILIIIAIPISIIFTLDLVISSLVTLYLKRKGKLKYADCTEKIKKEIKEELEKII